MNDDFDQDDILDDDFFYEHYGKQPVNRGGGSGKGCLSELVIVVVVWILLEILLK